MHDCASCGPRPDAPACPQCGRKVLPDLGRRGVLAGAVVGGMVLGGGMLEVIRAFAPGGTGARPSGDWRGDWLAGAEGVQRARDKQRSDQRPFLLYFYTDWCGFCRRLESGVLSTDEGRRLLRDVTKVRVNPESGRDELALAQELQIRGYPSLFFIHPDGRAARLRPPQAPSELESLLASRS